MFLSIIAVIIFLSLLILTHEFGHFWAAKKFGLWIEEFGFGLPPKIWSRKIGETIWSLNALPFGGFVRIFGEDGPEENSAELAGYNHERNFAFLSAWKKAVILTSGVTMNFILGWLMVSIVFMVGIPGGVIVSDVMPASPAASAGLTAGDKILGAELGAKKLDGDFNPEDFSRFVNDVAGEQVILKIERSGGKLDFPVRPRLSPPPNQGALGVLLIESGLPKTGILKSFWLGFKTSIEIVGAVLRAVALLILGLFGRNYSGFASLTGPVGIFKISAEAGRMGFIYLFQLLALVSLNLFTLNILPFPALDGGRLLFLLIEKIKGSPLPQKFEKYANAAGMIILLTLMLALTTKDIAGLLG